MSLSTGVTKRLPLPEVGDGIGGSSDATDVVLANEPLSSRSINVSLLVEEIAKGVIENGYETDSDIDPRGGVEV